MNRSFIALTIVLVGCGSESKDDKKKEAVEITPLSVESLKLQDSEVKTMCDFQKDFVHWFVPKYSPTLSIESEKCGDSRSNSVPAEFAEMNGKCKTNCYVHVFTLKDTSAKEFKLYSIVYNSETKTNGYLSQVEYGSFVLYDKAGAYDAESYRKNVSYSPDENLLRISLTFNEALKAFEQQVR
ncbi:MAG: hypothetical protein EOP04_10610 [Proteobacteria bacterium]|nr:MAG: hypothetical protein EOP04_10610 [Pseudomonadota bacterium]